MRDTALITAIHEAGHAVASLTDPYRFLEEVWIKQEPGGWSGMAGAGAARWQPNQLTIYGSHPDIETRARQNAWLDCIEYLAGPIAELRWRSRSRSASQLQGLFLAKKLQPDVHLPGSDIERTRVRLAWLDPDGVEEQFSKAWMEAEELTAKHWRRIVELGRWLAREQRLDGKEVRGWWHDPGGASTSRRG